MLGEQLQLLFTLYAGPCGRPAGSSTTAGFGLLFAPRSWSLLLRAERSPTGRHRGTDGGNCAGVCAGGDPVHHCLSIAREFPGHAAKRLFDAAELRPALAWPLRSCRWRCWPIVRLRSIEVVVALRPSGASDDLFSRSGGLLACARFGEPAWAAAMVATLVGVSRTHRWPGRVPSVGPIDVLSWRRRSLLFYAYILLGSDLRSLGEGLRARQHLRQQLDIATTNPRDADAQYQLGLIYQQRHQYDEAKRRFARAAEIDARRRIRCFSSAGLHSKKSRLDDAIELLTRAAALDDKCCSQRGVARLGRRIFPIGPV